MDDVRLPCAVIVSSLSLHWVNDLPVWSPSPRRNPPCLMSGRRKAEELAPKHVQELRMSLAGCQSLASAAGPSVLAEGGGSERRVQAGPSYSWRRAQAVARGCKMEAQQSAACRRTAPCLQGLSARLHAAPHAHETAQSLRMTRCPPRAVSVQRSSRLGCDLTTQATCTSPIALNARRWS